LLYITTAGARLISLETKLVYIGNNKYVIYDEKKMPQAQPGELSYELYVLGP
jgi:hypothetical protein